MTTTRASTCTRATSGTARRFRLSTTRYLIWFVLLSACGDTDDPALRDGGEDASTDASARTDSDTDLDASAVTDAPAADGAALDASESLDGGISPLGAVPLGAAQNYVILAQSAVTNAATSLIVGDVAVSPATAAALTGFTLTADASNTFSTSAQVTGRLYAASYMPPTPDNLTLAVSDMHAALLDAAARRADVSELGAGEISGMTIEPGVYYWSTSVPITGDITLAGSASDVWIFQIAGTLALGANVRVQLSGGALPKHVFWQVSGAVTLGADAHCEGVILAETSITLGAGASITGRLLAQTAVTVATSTVVAPAP